jgi:DNA (cytosine-5)-methyltransferase 1
MREFTVVSLFSGAGGLDIGLEKTRRFNVTACVEKIPAFAETLRLNRDAGNFRRKDALVYEIDITKLDPAQVLADLRMVPGEVDLVVGGPPCQSFSTTGRRGTLSDPRGTLLWEFLRFVHHIRPKFFLMENVRGLMSAAIRHRVIKQRPEHGGAVYHPDEEPGSVLRLFLSDLDPEYRVDCFEVNAVNYGAPQLRERVLFVGNRFNHLVEFPAPTHGLTTDEAQRAFFAKDLNPFGTLGDALKDLDDPNPVVMDFSPRKKHYLSMVPPGGNWRSLSADVAEESMGRAYFAKGGRSGWWRRLSFELPCPTLVTMPNHASTALCHPTETRALSIREYARIQEFPDTWTFAGKVPEQYAQVGNAVPVRLGEVAGTLISEHLDTIYRDDLRTSEGEHDRFRVVYLKSHVRTRHWYKNGKKVLWQDGKQNGSATYGPAKTEKKVKVIR